MPHSMRIPLCVVTATWAAMCCAQDPGEGAGARNEQKKRLELMRQRVQALKVEAAEDDVPAFVQKPVLRYNDTPRGVLDASVWVLGQTGRPRAVVVVEIYNYAQYELTAAADPPKSVQASSFRWTPRQDDFQWTEIPVSTPPSDTDNLRERQIKLVVEDFSASEVWSGRTYHLRLLDSPIYTYTDEEQGVLNGVVFAWAHGTNVEILMYIEARREQEDSPPRWVAGFSRLGSASLDVKYRQQDFWSAPSGFGVGPSSPYYFRTIPLTREEQAAFYPE